MAEIQKIKKQTKGQQILNRVRRDKVLYIILIPFLIWYALFAYMPMYGLQLAFKDYSPLRGIMGSDWVGMKHFINFFSGPYAFRVIRNTFILNLYDLGVNFTATIAMALLLNEIMSVKIRSSIQTIIYMPHFISTVVVAGMVVSILSPSGGIINNIIGKFGMQRVYFLAEPKYFRTIYTVMKGWQTIGFGTIIYTSAICGIDDSLYEAASLDGANRWKKMLHVTLPCIAPTISVMFIMKIGHMLNSSAEDVLLLYQPITYETADVINTYVYREGMENANYSYSTAVGLFNGVVSFVMVVIANKISNRVNETGLW